jgi:hypothetical protein
MCCTRVVGRALVKCVYGCLPLTHDWVALLQACILLVAAVECGTKMVASLSPSTPAQGHQVMVRGIEGPTCCMSWPGVWGGGSTGKARMAACHSHMIGLAFLSPTIQAYILLVLEVAEHGTKMVSSPSPSPRARDHQFTVRVR